MADELAAQCVEYFDHPLAVLGTRDIIVYLELFGELEPFVKIDPLNVLLVGY